MTLIRPPSKPPVPRCPPIRPPGLENLLYQRKLDRMSVPELQKELKAAEMRLYIASHGFVPNPEGVKKAQAQLQMVKAELATRPQPSSEYGKQYEAKLDKMSDAELRQELVSAQRQYYMATHGFAYIPEQVERATQRLQAVRAEMADRGLQAPLTKPGGWY